MAAQRFHSLVFSVLLCVLSLCGELSFSYNEPYMMAGIKTELNLLKREMPQSHILGNVNSVSSRNFWSFLDRLVLLNDLKSKVETVVVQSPNPYLQGLLILVNEVMSEGCDWLAHVIEGGFSCENGDVPGELRNKLEAHNVLMRSQLSLQEYAKLNSNCTMDKNSIN